MTFTVLKRIHPLIVSLGFTLRGQREQRATAASDDGVRLGLEIDGAKKVCARAVGHPERDGRDRDSSGCVVEQLGEDGVVARVVGNRAASLPLEHSKPQ